jgi:hypothetical protein
MNPIKTIHFSLASLKDPNNVYNKPFLTDKELDRINSLLIKKQILQKSA